MKFVYLSQMELNQKEPEPTFTPLGVENSSNWSCIDLRKDATVPGPCLVGMELPYSNLPRPKEFELIAPFNKIKNGSKTVIRKIRDAVRADIHSEDNRLDNWIHNLLIKSDKLGFCKPVWPMEDGNIRIYLGNILIFGPPETRWGHGTITESFDGPDKAGVGYDLIWTETIGTGWQNRNNMAYCIHAGVAGNEEVMCNTLMQSINHYAQIYLHSAGLTGGYYAGLNWRAVGVNDYYQGVFYEATPRRIRIHSRIGGVPATIGTVIYAWVNGDTLKCEGNGSTQNVYVSTVLVLSVTDTNLAGFQVGMRGYFDTDEWIYFDNFEASEINLDGSIAIPSGKVGIGIR